MRQRELGPQMLNADHDIIGARTALQDTAREVDTSSVVTCNVNIPPPLTFQYFLISGGSMPSRQLFTLNSNTYHALVVSVVQCKQHSPSLVPGMRMPTGTSAGSMQFRSVL